MAYDARFMRSVRTFIAPMVLLAVLGAACTGEQEPSDPATSDTPTDVVPSAVGTTKGKYVYDNAGLNARMELTADGGTLTVTNKTGRGIDEPGFYLLDARDGAQIDGKVAAASPVANGQTEEFDVTFAKPIETQNIGLVILVIGDDNYGAFVNE